MHEGETQIIASTMSCDIYIPSGPALIAAMPVRDDFDQAERQHQRDELVDLVAARR